MRIVILQYDNRVTELTPLMLRNKAYAEMHGYDYVFRNDPHDMPPYWIKIKLAALLLEDYDCVMWLDSDASVHTPLRIESLVRTGKTFYMAPDRPRWNSPFNAGVWIALDKMMMQEWMSLYDATLWQKKERWITSGEWAGSAYEQGSFCRTILPKYKEAIHIFPWHFLQAIYGTLRTKNNIFTVHFAGQEKTGMLKYQSLIEHAHLCDQPGPTA